MKNLFLRYIIPESKYKLCKWLVIQARRLSNVENTH